ncbi:MAG: TolC family protein, partial [Candidatus Brocadiaceae bacterium]
MREPVVWALAGLMFLAVGCRPLTPELVKDAADVRVSIEEADRAFLYSRIDQQRLIELVRGPEGEAQEARLYRFSRGTSELEEVPPDAESLRDIHCGDALLAVRVEGHAASINLWNWVDGALDEFTVLLDSLSAHRVRTPEGEPERYDVVFTASEPVFFPFSGERDYEIFKARLVAGTAGEPGGLIGLRQLTHNSWDDTCPAFSPDGHWVVFVSEQLGPRNVALMDSAGDYRRLLTRDSARSSYHPVVLPDNERCLYVSGSDGSAEFFICGLDGRGHRKASAQELKQRLFAWDDGTRHAYLLTDAFAHEQSIRLLMDLPRKVDLLDLLLLAEWNSPRLAQYREKIRAARSARIANAKAKGIRLAVGGTHMVDVGTLVAEPEQSPQDRPAQGFTRYLFTLSVPLFTGSLQRAIRQRDLWQELAYTQTYRERYGELACAVATHYFDYSENVARLKALRRAQDLNRKRKFLLEARLEAGKERPGKLEEADAHIRDTEAELTDARGKAEAAKNRLLAAVGLKGSGQIEVVPASLDWQTPPVDVPALEEMQALTQLNHPELGRLKFLELRAAAIRDMGPPETRGRPTLNLTYGLGAEHFFSETVDDFISTGIGHALPLETLGLNRSYREQWTHEMLSYRREREQARLDLNADLQETHAALERLLDDFESTRNWRDLAAEKVRLRRIYDAGARLPDGMSHGVTDTIDVQTEYLEQVMALAAVRADFWRHLAKYYRRAGLARRLAEVLRSGEPTGQSARRSVWLWRSLEVVLSPEERDGFLRTCAENGIGRVYCFVSRVENELYLREYNWEFGYFLDLCRERGLEVYALVGNPRWVEPAYREEIGAILRSVVEFSARSQQGEAGFAGVKLDVEPHALPDWQKPSGRARLAEAYLETLRYVRAQLGREGAELRLTADVPYTWRGVEAGDADLLTRAFNVLDEVTVMAYLRRPEGIVEKVEPIL